MSSIPLWAIALVLAGAAPFLARAFAMLATRRVEERTRSLLATAKPPSFHEPARASTREGET